jgi:hypothetical protein
MRGFPFSKEASIVERPAFRAFARHDHRSGNVQADDRPKVQRIPTLRVAVALSLSSGLMPRVPFSRK